MKDGLAKTEAFKYAKKCCSQIVPGEYQGL